MARLPILFCSFLVLLSLFGGVSAEEETVSISVNVPMKGDYPDETNVSHVPRWWSMDIALGQNFTFTFIADNLENGTEYVFSYEIVNIQGEGVNASHLFIANNTEKYSTEKLFIHSDLLGILQ